MIDFARIIEMRAAVESMGLTISRLRGARNTLSSRDLAVLRLGLTAWRQRTTLAHHVWEPTDTSLQIWKCWETRDGADGSSLRWPDPISMMRVYVDYEWVADCAHCGAEVEVHDDPCAATPTEPYTCEGCAEAFREALFMDCVDCGEELARHIHDEEHVCDGCHRLRVRGTVRAPAPPFTPVDRELETLAASRSTTAA